MSFIRRLLLILFTTSSLIGCSELPKRVPVSGVVLIDGEPLTGGSVSFVPEHGRPATSEVMTDGTFELGVNSISAEANLLGVVPGDYRVAVSAPQVLSEDSGKVRWLAPSKYADFRTSGIEVKIGAPEENLKIELTWLGNETLPAEEVSKEASEETLQIDSETEEAQETETEAEPMNNSDQEANSQP